MTASDKGFGLTTVEYAHLAEQMGWSHLAPEVFNCSAPDTGNMEVFEKYGTEEHKKKWLEPMLDGKIRSAYLMTEPDVASSDATNLEFWAEKDGDEWVLNGEKYWSSGAGDPRTKVYILMARTEKKGDFDRRHKQHSMFVVPADTPGISKLRAMTIFGQDDAPHGHLHMKFENVRIPADALLIGEGRGFEVSQGRLGPGRIHHCMRAIGQAERALEAALPTCHVPRGVRSSARQAGRELRHHRGLPHWYRTGATAVPEGGGDHGYGATPRRLRPTFRSKCRAQPPWCRPYP